MTTDAPHADEEFVGFVAEPDGRLRPPRLFRDQGLDPTFWHTGFVKLPLLGPEQMAALKEGFASLRPFDGFDPRTLENSRCDYHCTFLDPDRTYRRESDELVRELLDEPIRSVLPGYRIMSSNIYVKPPGTGRFEIHQNWPTIENIDIPTFTVWIPLQDTGFHNGTIRLVPGGHRVFPDIAAASSDRFFDDFERELIETQLQPIEMVEGEALFFDDSLLHWSSDNLSDAPRITFQIELVPVDARSVLWIRDPEDPTQFDVWEADREYWIEYDFESVLGKPEGLTYVGSRPNPNRRLTFEEFEATMHRADEIRRAKFVLD
jgi:hypothetical protein